uniref:Uncharacterized protein n=1 Tax=Helianthus annuus TaxID=4232 RepID=A0A251TMD0_HELAN
MTNQELGLYREDALLLCVIEFSIKSSSPLVKFWASGHQSIGFSGKHRRCHLCG